MLFSSAKRKRIDIVFRAVSVFQRASRAARHAWCFARISSAVRPRVTGDADGGSSRPPTGAFSRATSRTPSGPFARESERRAGNGAGRERRIFLEAPVPSSKTSAEAYAVSSRVSVNGSGGRRRPPACVPGYQDDAAEIRSRRRSGTRRALSPFAAEAVTARESGPKSPSRRRAKRSRAASFEGVHAGRRDDERDVLRREARGGGEQFTRRGADAGEIEVDETRACRTRRRRSRPGLRRDLAAREGSRRRSRHRPRFLLKGACWTSAWKSSPRRDGDRRRRRDARWGAAARAPAAAFLSKYDLAFGSNMPSWGVRPRESRERSRREPDRYEIRFLRVPEESPRARATGLPPWPLPRHAHPPES